MSPASAAVLGALGGALAGFLGATAVGYLAVGDVRDEEEVRRFRKVHRELNAAEARAAMRRTKSGLATAATVMGAVVGGALSASTAAHPDKPAGA